MQRRSFASCAAAALLFAGVSLGFGAEIEFVAVGDPGNTPGFTVGYKTVIENGVLITIPITVGAVPHAFRIGKYELTRAQYLEFLNKADPEGTNALKLWNESNAVTVGILRNATAPVGQKYYLDNALNANLPIMVPSWYAAARFCNWLHHNKGGPETTEGDAISGAYDTRSFDDQDVSNDPIGHNPGAKFWIPTEDEWIKACHYKGGGVNAGYWTGPNRTNADPAPGFPPGGPNSAHIASSSVPVPPGTLSVGSYPNSFSPYGAYDMAGNEHEWTESWFEGDNWTLPNTRRMSRGGHYRWLADHTRIWYRAGTHQKAPWDWRCTFRPAATSVNDAPVLVSGPTATPNPTRVITAVK